MASGTQKAQANNEAVRQWVAARDAAGDYIEYERQGKVNRGALCEELDFARSVVNQNPAVKAILADAEARWYGVREEDTKSLKAATVRSEVRVAKTASDNSRLLDELAKLKAENTLLKRQLEKYAAMDEIIKTTGLVRL
jgi:hypothetical protein